MKKVLYFAMLSLFLLTACGKSNGSPGSEPKGFVLPAYSSGTGTGVEIDCEPDELLLSPQAVSTNKLNSTRYGAFLIIYTFTMVFIQQ